MSLDDSLDRVAQKLTDDVFEVGKDVGEASAKMTLDLDLGDGNVGAVDGTGEGLGGGSAVLNDVLGDALDEDLADEVGVGEGGAGGEGGGVVGFCEG